MQFLTTNNIDGTKRIYSMQEAVARIATFMREVRGHSDNVSGKEAADAVIEMTITGEQYDATMKDGTAQFSIAPGYFIPSHTDELAVEGHDEGCFSDDCKNAPCVGSGSTMNMTQESTDCPECGLQFYRNEATATVS